jgi:hypothetical protein
MHSGCTSVLMSGSSAVSEALLVGAVAYLQPKVLRCHTTGAAACMSACMRVQPVWVALAMGPGRRLWHRAMC